MKETVNLIKFVRKNRSRDISMAFHVVQTSKFQALCPHNRHLNGFSSGPSLTIHAICPEEAALGSRIIKKETGINVKKFFDKCVTSFIWFHLFWLDGWCYNGWRKQCICYYFLRFYWYFGTFKYIAVMLTIMHLEIQHFITSWDLGKGTQVHNPSQANGGAHTFRF